MRWRAPSGARAEKVLAEHAFYLRPASLSVAVSGAGALGEVLRTSRFVLDLEEVPGERAGESWVRVRVRDRGALQALCAPPREADADGPADSGGFLARLGVETFEADLHPVKRWMLERRVPVGRPVRYYLDTEAHLPDGVLRFDAGRLLCWSLVDEEDAEVARGVLREDSPESERTLLAELVVALDGCDQIAAWGGDRFDFELLAVRAQRVGLEVEWRRWLRLDHLLAFRRANVSASKSGEEKQSYSLAAVAAVVLGEEKKVDLAEGTHLAMKMWVAGGAERERLADYCRDDAGKMARIERRTGYLANHQAICEVAGVLPDSRSIGPKSFVEAALMRLGHNRGVRFPSFWGRDVAPEKQDEKHFAGAYVQKPSARELGIRRDVHVLDFARLYPSVAQTFNCSPETLVKNARDVKRVPVGDPRGSATNLAYYEAERPPPGVLVCPGSGHWFKAEPRGLLPQFFDEMLRLRAEHDDEKKRHAPGTEEWIAADRRSTAYKNMTNAGFGVTGSVWSRFFVVECAESMTLGGVHLIQLVIREAEKRGMHSLMGDTDSTFLERASRAEVEAFVAHVNAELLPEVARAGGAADCRLSLAYEKAFERVVVTAGKRYAGRYAHFKGKAATAETEPEVKGLEFKRGDCPRLARQMQAEVLDLLLGGGVLDDPARGRRKKTLRREHCEEDPKVFLDLVNRWRDRVLGAPLALEEVSDSRRLSKEPSAYSRPKRKDGTLGLAAPQARIAEVLKGRGRDVGAGVRVAYFVADKVDGVVLPAEDFDGENVDRLHLWESRIYPPTQRLLEACFPTVKWALWRQVRKHAAPKEQSRFLFE